MGDFQKLRSWQKAKSIAVDSYKITNQDVFTRDLRLKDQLRSSALSISSNIAEGDELNTNKQANKHFYIAKGSCAELKSLIIICVEIGYLSKEIGRKLYDDLEHISIMLYKLIKARS